MNFFDDDLKLLQTVEFYLGPEHFEAIRGELSGFGAETAGELVRHLREATPEAARLIHRSGIMALHSEPGNAVEHMAMCLMIARAGGDVHLRNIALESGLAKLLSVVDVEELRFEFMAGLLDRRVEVRPRVGQTEFDFEFPPHSALVLPMFYPGSDAESSGSLRGKRTRVSRGDANLLLALAKDPSEETALCLVRAESFPTGDGPWVDLDGAIAWRLGTRRHTLEFNLDFLRANDQAYALIRKAGADREPGADRLVSAWSDALLAGGVYLAYLEDMVELGGARQPEAVFRRVMLECTNTLPAQGRIQDDRLAREMREKNLWPLCGAKFEKFLDELEDPRLGTSRGILRERLDQLMSLAESNPVRAAAPARAGELFLTLALASEANWSLKHRDDRAKLDSLSLVMNSWNAVEG